MSASDAKTIIESAGFNVPSDIEKLARKNKANAEVDKIAQKIKYLSARMVEGLKSLNGVKLYYENENGVVSFNVRDIPSGEAAIF